MPIYNNPAIGQAFENIAGMFAAPSGSDAAGWALAKERSAEAARRQQLYEYARDPNYDPTTADRMGVLGGLYAPSQSREAVVMGDTTARRGQDVIAQTALTTNAADNARALQERQMQEAGAMQRDLAKPVIVAQDATAFIPGAVSDATGLPSVLAGKASPLSETQMIAQIMGQQSPETQAGFVRDKFAPELSKVEGMNTQRLIDEGDVTDDMLRDAIIGKEAPVQVVGPDGAPRYSTPGEAVRTGAQPFINRGAEAAPTLRNYEAPGGKMGSARWDNQQRTWLDANTNAVLPEGTVTFNGELSGGTSETGFGAQKANLTKATDLEASVDAAAYRVKEMKSILQQNANVAGVPGRIKGVLQSLASSAQQVAGAYAEAAPDAAMSIEEARQMAEQVLPKGTTNYDPNIVRLQSGIFDLAYSRAQLNNPGGEVSRQAFERSLESFGQTVLASQQDLAVGLDAFERDTIGAARVQINSLRGQRNERPSEAPAASSGNVERWERVNGKLQRAAN